MNFHKVIGLVVMMLVGAVTHAKITINNLEYQSLGSENGKIIISYNGFMKDFPELKVQDNFVEVLLPEAMVNNKINKQINLVSNNDTKLVAYQYTKNTVRVRAVADFDIKKIQGKAHINVKDDKVELIFPKAVKVGANKPVVKTKPQVKFVQATPVKKVERAKKVKKNIEDYDESYLDYLIEKKGTEKTQETKEVVDSNTKIAAAATTIKANELPKTEKRDLGTSRENVDKKTFSAIKYLGKYVAFLGIILLALLAVFTLFKKGVLKKGKLGFLNKTDAVQVMSTTYIGPKSSLLLVKVHNQTFLLSKTETGVNFLSEVTDTNGLLKEGEKALTGSNFDTNLFQNTQRDDLETSVKLKENPIPVVDTEEKLKKFMNDNTNVKISDQVRKKLRGLKPLNH